jgi:ABC-2 type transport system permease protein
MAVMTLPRAPASGGILYAFIERQTNLWKRYWAWELVWLVYGAVNTLAVTFIAKQSMPPASPAAPTYSAWCSSC